ncbi:MAG: hypothetical protein MZV63_46430 [Marinilabiliales bacterium]|nr:hypothetical protein [Marinilabiliales bacterium]
MLQTDRDFSAMSEKEGMFVAFLAYIADDGVMLQRIIAYPATGKDSCLGQGLKAETDTSFVLTWEPLYEKIAESGELGYTYGIHTNTRQGKRSRFKRHLRYCLAETVDGSWKYILDSGTQGLPEK